MREWERTGRGEGREHVLSSGVYGGMRRWSSSGVAAEEESQ